MIPSTQAVRYTPVKPKAKAKAGVAKNTFGYPGDTGTTVQQAPEGNGRGLLGNVTHDAIRTVVGKMPTHHTASQGAPGPGTAQPAPLSPLEQAQQVVSSTLTPLEQQLIGSYTSQGAAGAAAIRQLTAQYVSQMGQLPTEMQGIYGTAEQSNAAANDALANRLSGAGTGASDELAQRLASIEQPGAVNPVISQLAGNATGSGNALYAGGNAALEQLIGQGANAQTYAAKLPGIARETGIQSLGSYEGQIGSAEQQALGTLEGKAPGLVQQALGTITKGSQAADAATATAAYRAALLALGNDKAGQNALALAAKSGMNADGTLNSIGQAIFKKYGITVPPGAVVGSPKASKPVLFGSDKEGRYSLDPTTGAVTELVRPLVTPTRPIVFGSAKEGRFSYDPTTGATMQLTSPAASSGGTPGTGGLSASGWSSLVKTTNSTVAKGLTGAPAHQHAVDVRDPTTHQVTGTRFVPVPGTGSAPVSYGDALASAIANGPSTAAWAKKAKQIVNSHYQPGEDGRPFEGAQAVTQITDRGKKSIAHGVSYQDALQAGLQSGMFPPNLLRSVLTKLYAAAAKKLSTTPGVGDKVHVGPTGSLGVQANG